MPPAAGESRNDIGTPSKSTTSAASLLVYFWHSPEQIRPSLLGLCDSSLRPARQSGGANAAAARGEVSDGRTRALAGTEGGLSDLKFSATRLLIVWFSASVRFICLQHTSDSPFSRCMPQSLFATYTVTAVGMVAANQRVPVRDHCLLCATGLQMSRKGVGWNQLRSF